MIGVQNIKSINTLWEWFTYTTVLCGLLIFSGPVSESRISNRGITQTELRVSIENNSRSIVPYRELSIASNAALSYPDYGSTDRNAFLVHYEGIIETRLLNNVQHWISCNKPGKLVRTPYTRRSYNESELNSLRG
jgi:hypothetical protein